MVSDPPAALRILVPTAKGLGTPRVDGSPQSMQMFTFLKNRISNFLFGGDVADLSEVNLYLSENGAHCAAGGRGAFQVEVEVEESVIIPSPQSFSGIRTDALKLWFASVYFRCSRHIAEVGHHELGEETEFPVGKLKHFSNTKCYILLLRKVPYTTYKVCLYHTTRLIQSVVTVSARSNCRAPIRLNFHRYLHAGSTQSDDCDFPQFTLRIAGNATAEVNFTHTGILASVDFARNPGDLA
ncbi:hypothetical protein B0H14DRAFT_2559846 [Mycena olivaceomarginata]|nr:hypothetical protein B0H14DRAFT_2559846 [Mycena olivaceomarginata]